MKYIKLLVLLLTGVSLFVHQRYSELHAEACALVSRMNTTLATVSVDTQDYHLFSSLLADYVKAEDAIASDLHLSALLAMVLVGLSLLYLVLIPLDKLIKK